MAEDLTIARPYAEAIFKLALQEKTFTQWSDLLAFIGPVAADPDMRQLITNPRLTQPELERVFLSICEGRADAQGRNLIALLVHNGRLALLPEIRLAYEKLKEAHEGVLEALVYSAFPLEPAELEGIAQQMEARFKQKVLVTAKLEPSLIGGVKISLGDVVIDASVRGQLENLAVALKH